jgi:hypothetical protein
MVPRGRPSLEVGYGLKTVSQITQYQAVQSSFKPAKAAQYYLPPSEILSLVRPLCQRTTTRQ